MDKIYFIRNSIKNNTISHGYITNFINIHNINYSENKNGMFINLSKLDISIIDKLYEYIVNYTDIDNNDNSIEFYKINVNTSNNNKKKQTYIKKEKLSEVEKQIIKLSKDI